jgi:hypothetical protein
MFLFLFVSDNDNDDDDNFCENEFNEFCKVAMDLMAPFNAYLGASSDEESTWLFFGLRALLLFKKIKQYLYRIGWSDKYSTVYDDYQYNNYRIF